MNKKLEKNLVWHYAKAGIMILGLSFIFSLLSVVFLSDEIAWYFKLPASLVFIAPIAVVLFSLGSSHGQEGYKITIKMAAALYVEDDKTIERKLGYNIGKSLLYMISFAAPLTLLLLLSFITQQVAIRGVALLFLMPFNLLLTSFGWMDVTTVSLLSVSILFVAILLLMSLFALGYYVGGQKQRRVQRDIDSEKRLFGSDRG